MNVAPLSLGTVVFAGPASMRPAAPSTIFGAATRFIATDQSSTEPLAELERLAPAVTVLLAVERLDPAIVRRLPGLRVGVTSEPLQAHQASELRASASEGLLELATLVAGGDPALGDVSVLAETVDTAPFSTGPRPLSNKAVLVAGSHPRELAKALALRVPVEVLDPGAAWDRQLHALSEATLFFAAPGASTGSGRRLSLHALAAGLLVVGRSPFPPEWGIEAGDEYLDRGAADWARTVEHVVERPGLFFPVRVRGWQKVREAFDARFVFERLLFDVSARRVLGTRTDPALRTA